MRRNSTYSVSPSLKTLLCEVPALGVEHTAWPGWLSQEQSREQSTGRGPRQMLLLGELLGSGLWSRGIGIWSRLPSASSRPGSSQGSDPGRGSPFLPRALAHAQPHLESLLPPSLWMETPSQLPAHGQVCFGATWGVEGTSSSSPNTGLPYLRPGHIAPAVSQGVRT